MAEERDIWIDQAYSASEYRVRERVGVESETLGVFSTRPQAEDFMDRTLHPEKYADEGNDEPVEDMPGMKDTVLVEGEDEVRLYTDFNNPGLWMAHCHILEHAELGMMVNMVVSEPTP